MKEKECRCRKLCIPAALNTSGSLVDAGGNLMDQVGHEKKTQLNILQAEHENRLKMSLGPARITNPQPVQNSFLR